MKVFDQSLEDILGSLGSLDVEWMDEVAVKAIAKLASIDQKVAYSRDDVRSLLDADFEEGLLCCRLFLGLSKDNMNSTLTGAIGSGGIGVKAYTKDPDAYCAALERLGLLDRMAETINVKPVWSDILVERLRSGRGSAISGQRRGRGLEDFTEAIVKQVFGIGGYQTRVAFSGTEGRRAKCDFAIPDRTRPQIVIESKGYGATGSKMTDIIGDLDAIIEAKRHDTAFLFITDGTTWNARQSDLRKIIARQNEGTITRIYTSKMAAVLKQDLEVLKAEKGL